MEQKTIGRFISALRKANGMTQKDLAERLNVSDKTVSRWERDEGAPDLSAIPVIAEIFGVTCDELLRGERKSPEARTCISAENDPTPKGEKQRHRLLKSALSRYQSRTYIAMGLSAAGIIAALICNLAFLKAVLGFLVGSIFFAASIVCQAIFINRAFFSVEDAQLSVSDISDYRRAVIKAAKKSFGLTAAFIGFTFPLILMDAYVGLSADNMLIFGIGGMLVFLLIYAVALYFVNASIFKNGVYALSEKEVDIYHRNRKLKRTCAIVLAALFAVTFICHHVSTRIWGPLSVMDGTTFNDYESFTAYMEQDIPASPMYEFHGGTVSVDVPAAPPEQVGPSVYYDEYGNEISEEEALTRRLTDINGNVVCEYIDRNESVVSLRYSPKDGTVLPITVCTDDDLRQARETVSVRHMIFAAVYFVEVIAVLFVYFRKRAR